MELGCDGINGIHHKIRLELVEKIAVFRKIELIRHKDFSLLADGQQPFFGSQTFLLSQHVPGGKQLTVQIGFLHRVMIHQEKMADSSPPKGFRRTSAHAAQA